jgi:hypothetical protein
VVGWERWRELDRRHILGGVRATVGQLAGAGRVEPTQVDMLSHMILAAVGEAAMVVATAADPAGALRSAQDTVATLLTRLFGPEGG